MGYLPIYPSKYSNLHRWAKDRDKLRNIVKGARAWNAAGKGIFKHINLCSRV